MKKKLLWAVFCVLFSMLFVFAACAPANTGDGNDDGGNGGEQQAGDEYTLEIPDGYRQLTIYWNRSSGDYSDCDVWMWYDNADAVALLFHECEYGGKVILNVPEETAKVGFIIRTNCSAPGVAAWDGVVKDGTDADRWVTLRGKSTVIYTKSGDGSSYESEDGGKTLQLVRYIALADITDLRHIQVTMSDPKILVNKLENVRILDADGKELEYAGITNKNVIVTKQDIDISQPYTLNIDGYDPAGIVPSTYYSSEEFESQYTYDGELGVDIGADKVTFRLWAPTASKVLLNIYSDGEWGESKTHFPLVKGEKGVWSYEGDRFDANNKEKFVGKYYTYTVTTSMGAQEAVDPYARSAGMNGRRGMIIDLDKTDPDGWTTEKFTEYAGGYEVNNYTDANIWEIHIRDFSNKISGLSEAERGKYLAFTKTGLTNAAGKPVGIDYLKELGITHVHLLPSYDYASVDESDPDAAFNWGYDPQNYNVPEGSYSSNPSNGAVRVNEYKQMVQALHNAGIGVIMDVVYNHTFSADSNFTKIVPNYYYRYNNGVLSNGSGCGNETASERSMVKKFIVDSVNYWLDEYNLDGFRFDLMGLHDIETMKEVESTVHAKNPHALIYGEGWTGGTSTLPGEEQSKLDNIGKLNGSNKNGVAMFNDVIRDGIKGSVFDINDTGYATGAKADYLGRVLFGVQGGFANAAFSGHSASWSSASPTNVINYCSAHDNNTLWDRICHVDGTDASTLETRLAKNRLSAAIIQTSLGVPFMQAGEEMLRAKINEDGSYNENSYNASDEVNNLKWDLLTDNSPEYQMMQYYKGLIAFRKSCPTLRLAEITAATCKIVQKDGAFVAFTIESGSEKVLIVYNAGTTAHSLNLTGNWNLYINGTQAGATAIQSGLSGTQQITPISCYVYKQA